MGETLSQQEAVDQTTQILAQPIIEQQQNDEVREYTEGETVRTTTGYYGEIIAMNEDGTYRVGIETPQGVAQVTVRPMDIVNEDNLSGLEDGDTVTYVDEEGTEAKGEIHGLYNSEYRKQGMVEIDGELVPVESVQKFEDSTIPENGDTGIQKVNDTNDPMVPMIPFKKTGIRRLSH